MEAVANANPNTIAVLETGNPVSMPWRDKVKAVVQAWFPGQAGAKAIAEVLTGKVNPSGCRWSPFPPKLAIAVKLHSTYNNIEVPSFILTGAISFS
ncbi:glycoside hydrolase family 3 C-terminal domain-containing protein [Rhizobium setariae]|uniref:glycoside hydrolase family 3 protein n=1 Tax=Rhizobium setariae TaxID=2801340 RepID=UPI0031BB603C